MPHPQARPPAPPSASSISRECGPTPIDAEVSASILMIEDNPDIAEMYKLKLELDGYRVTVAPSGEDGLDQVRQQLPDLIFLDIGLPKMDGLAVLGQLRAQVKTTDIPVVILSADDEPELKERGRTLGALDYLIKPLTTPSSLSRRVEDWASRRQLAGV